jgi:hypothetical protein
VDVPFPTSDEAAAFAEFMHFKSLEDLLRQRAPEYAERIERPDTAPLHLKIRLDDGTGVLVGWLSKPPGAWVITGPEPARSVTRVWSLDTPDEVLVEALRVRAAARLAGASEPVPWRWDEAVESEATQLSELLEAAGFSIVSVVAGNRVFAVKPQAPDGAKVWIAKASDGDYVRASLGRAEVRVGLKPVLGWVADVLMAGESRWRRLDLGQLITGQPSAVPGIPAESLEVPVVARTLAAAVTDLASAPGRESLSSAALLPPPSARTRGSELASGVAAQLHAMAFGDIEVHDDPVAPLRSKTFHVAWRASREDRLRLPELQRLNGIAAAAGKLLMVISAGIVTRPALSFANEARMFVFDFDPGPGVLFNGSNRCAEAYLTGWSDWISTLSA